MKKRLTFQCYKCNETYSLTLELEGEPTFNLACPFCETKAQVDLNPYIRPAVTIHRDDTTPLTFDDLDLPAIIPTAGVTRGE